MEGCFESDFRKIFAKNISVRWWKTGLKIGADGVVTIRLDEWPQLLRRRHSLLTAVPFGQGFTSAFAVPV